MFISTLPHENQPKTQALSTYRKLKKQKGYSMLELLIAVVVVAGLTLGVLKLKDMVTSSNDSTQLLTDLTAIQTGLNQLYMGQGRYGTASLNKVLIVGKKIPTNMKTTGDTTITTQHGGSLTVMGKNDRYSIEVTNIPTSMCQSLLTGMTSGWRSVKVNSGSELTSFPISPVDATNSCSAADNVSITWTSKN